MLLATWVFPFQPIILGSIFIVVLIATLFKFTGQTTLYDLYFDHWHHDIIRKETTLHYRSYFYVGGEYLSAHNSTVSFGQMYVEHLVPIKVLQPFPIVFIPGNGRSF